MSVCPLSLHDISVSVASQNADFEWYVASYLLYDIPVCVCTYKESLSSNKYVTSECYQNTLNHHNKLNDPIICM